MVPGTDAMNDALMRGAETKARRRCGRLEKL